MQGKADEEAMKEESKRKAKSQGEGKPIPNPAGRKGDPITLFPVPVDEAFADILKVRPPGEKNKRREPSDSPRGKN